MFLNNLKWFLINIATKLILWTLHSFMPHFPMSELLQWEAFWLYPRIIIRIAQNWIGNALAKAALNSSFGLDTSLRIQKTFRDILLLPMYHEWWAVETGTIHLLCQDVDLLFSLRFILYFKDDKLCKCSGYKKFV